MELATQFLNRTALAKRFIVCKKLTFYVLRVANCTRIRDYRNKT